jgi:trk system potassium uptake protein TrkH
VYLGIMLLASAAIAVTTLPLYGDWLKGIRDIMFTVASLQSSTGFAVTDYEKWSQSAQWVLLLVMIIGGCAGSTAGGLKVIRIYLVAKYIASDFTRLLHPQAVVPVRSRGVAVPRDVTNNILSFFALYGLAIFSGTLIITFFGMDWVSALSGVVSMLSNVGPGMNVIGPYDHYGNLHVVVKWVLILCMLLGRLEFYAILVLFAPAYWRK